MSGQVDLKSALSHVLWIGGSTDAGKTSVARALAEKYGLQAYHYDLYDRTMPPGHWARIDPKRHPHMHASPVDDRDWMWVDTTPEELVERWQQTNPERFQLVLEDLLALPTTPPIVAEGYGFAPDLVQPLLSSPYQAIWLISTEAFKRATYERRGKGAFTDTRDPERARRNHIGRDLLLAEYLRRRAEERELPFIEVDGTRSLEEIVSLVEAHFMPLLGA
jgi:2-phosphoglycerate kinase